MAEAPKDREADALRSFLANRDTPCPGCGYNLRGLTDATCPECGIPIELSVANRDPLWSWRRLIACAWASLVLFCGVSLLRTTFTVGGLWGNPGMPTWFYVQYIAWGAIELAAFGLGVWCLVEMWRARARPRHEGPWRRSLRRFLVLSTAIALARCLLYLGFWFLR